MELELEPESPPIIRGVGVEDAGGLPPKVNPTPRGVGGACPLDIDCDRGNWTLEPALGMVLTGASMSFFNSSSCDPSSVIVEVGREPGRGKKMDRLRECRRVCLRLCFGDVGGGSLGVSEAEASGGSDLEAASCGGKGNVLVAEEDEGGMSGLNGKEDARGDGWGGANGPETDRVRL